MDNQVVLDHANKIGVGIGSHIKFYQQSSDSLEYVGTLTFHDGWDWQVTDSSLASQFVWEIFDCAITQARKVYPNG